MSVKLWVGVGLTVAGTPVASSNICKMLPLTIPETATVDDVVKSKKAVARVSP